MNQDHRLGAWPAPGGTRFAIWSDKAAEILIRWRSESSDSSGELRLAPGSAPHVHTGWAPDVSPGTMYEVILDGVSCVDPYARSLPRGVHGPAEVAEIPRKPARKRAIELERGEVFYELHVGAFTREGTFQAAASKLPELVKLGVTVVEVMPIIAFAGQRGWGYDGVAFLAPFAAYGTVQDVLGFVDAAHECGLSVVLDVVYNHLGPDGDSLPAFSDSYFDSKRENAWGKAPAFDRGPFRQLILDSARYWLQDVGFDGLRIDAAHELEPGGEPHILEALSAVARDCVPPAALIAEDDRNDPKKLFELGVDAVWSDDLHHCLHVMLTGERDGYYQAFQGDLAELARIIERAQLYDGQVSSATGDARGVPSADVPRHRLVYSLQNHDQVGNRALGERLHTLCNLQQFHAVTLLLLSLPCTPLLFMGQEAATDSPFLYFTDQTQKLGEAVTKGRRDEFAGFAGFEGGDSSQVPDPQDEQTFQRSKVNDDAPGAEAAREFHRRALMMRRNDAVLRTPKELWAGVEGSVLWVFASNTAGRRLLLLNIGGPVVLSEIGPERVAGARVILSTAPVLHDGQALSLPAECCCVFDLGAVVTEA